MNEELIALRILHIVSGVFWVGAAVYLALVLEPRLHQLDRNIERDVLESISKLNSLWITLSAIITMIAGLILVERTPGRDFGQLFDTGWGVAIGSGLVVSVLAFFLSGWVGANTAKLRRALNSEGEPDRARLASVRARIAFGSRLNAALVIVAVGTMASARFV